MIATDDVTTCNTDHRYGWFGTGCDDAWPDRHADLPQRPLRPAIPYVFGREIDPRIAIASSNQSVRPACSLPAGAGATVKSP
jgi:hypothetical protein